VGPPFSIKSDCCEWRTNLCSDMLILKIDA